MRQIIAARSSAVRAISFLIMTAPARRRPVGKRRRPGRVSSGLLSVGARQLSPTRLAIEQESKDQRAGGEKRYPFPWTCLSSWHEDPLAASGPRPEAVP